MNEKQAFDRVINVLTEHNLYQTQDYIIERYHNGCFTIRICPHRFAVLDIQYIYSRIPDIKIFKVKQSKNIMTIILKIRLR